MFIKPTTDANQDVLNAFSQSQAMIEFTPEGIILTANQNFLNAVGYTLEEIKGKHHSLLVDSIERETSAYKAFWPSLASGKSQTAEFKRINKAGHDIWIQASYNPILDKSGKVYKIVKIATDITAAKLESANYTGQIKAIHKSQAVIEFDLNGIF